MSIQLSGHAAEEVNNKTAPSRSRLGRELTGLILACLTAAGIASGADKPPINYDRDVRPILSENCFLCHGQDSKKRMAGLRLDSFEGATADRGGHAALAPGKLESSAIYQRITAEQPARRMPPVFSNRSLTTDQIAADASTHRLTERLLTCPSSKLT